MRHLILTLLTLASLNCFGQKMIEYKIDDKLTINLPDNFMVFDTLGQRIIKSTFDNGLIIISKAAIDRKTSVNINDEKELIEFYNGIEKGVIGASQGDLISERIIEINKLKLTRFSYRAKMGEEIQIRDYLGLLLNDSIYSFHFWQLESKTSELKRKNEDFFISLKIKSGLSLKNQFTNGETSSYKLGYSIGRLFGYVFVLGTLALIIVLILKRKKNTRTPLAKRHF